MDLSRALEAAVDAARVAGDVLRADFHRPGGARGIEDKAEADLEAEREIRGRLLRAFPGWGYLGEETGGVAGAASEPVWLVDPNDGTRDYLVGRRGSAVSIGLVADGRPVLGVVFAFSYPDDAGNLFAWAEGCGPLLRNGRPARAEVPPALGPAETVLVSSKADRDPGGNLFCAAPARYRSLPSIAHRLALVAAGEAAAAVSLYAPGSWDYGAGQALLRAVGGVLVDEAGREVGYGEGGLSQCERAFAGSAAVASLLSGRPWDKPGSASPEPWSLVTCLRRGEALADAGRLSRAQGCMLGQVAGDSLGGLVEFASAMEVERRYPGGPGLLEDGGHWGLLAGQPTDDSEMALALARSIVTEGRFDESRVLVAYDEWFQSGPFDVGGTIRSALAGRVQPYSQANGSLMRVSPLGIYGCGLPAEHAAEIARKDSGLTHPHPVCGDAAAALVVAIRQALLHGDGPESAWQAALTWARGANAAHPVIEALEGAAIEPPVCDGEKRGFVLIALRNAFFELLHAPSLEEGVVATVRRGGDTDTNAAVAGALLGALHGREAVPEQWRRMILSCRPHLSRALHPRPMAYWPVDVLELAERLVLTGAAQT